jgi:hypothetical protein
MDNSHLAQQREVATHQGWRAHDDKGVRVAEGDSRWRKITHITSKNRYGAVGSTKLPTSGLDWHDTSG